MSNPSSPDHLKHQPLDPKPLSLNHFLSTLQDFLQRTLGERIEVQTVGSAGLWDVELDANHLESAVVNLAINARDAMPEGDKFTIEAVNVSADEDYSQLNPELAPGQYVVLSVTDSRQGMTPDTLSHAFEPSPALRLLDKSKELFHLQPLSITSIISFGNVGVDADFEAPQAVTKGQTS